MNLPRWIGVVSLLVWLDGCSTDRSSGNSMETENSITARSLLVDSLLATNLINIMDTGHTVATLRLDGSNFDFSQVDSLGRGLEFRRENGASIPFEIHFWDGHAQLGRIRVRIERDLRFAKSRIIFLSGLGTKAPVSDSSETWKGISASRQMRLTSVLVDNFEDSNTSTLLPFVSAWRAGTVIGYTYTNPVNVAADHGRAGQAMHFTYTAPLPHYGVVATPINGPRSLRGLDSVVFWARGNGKVWLAFEHLTGNSGPKAWTSRPLDTSWTRYCIVPQKLDPPDSTGSNVGWMAVRDSVTDLSFITQGGSEIYLDDVRMHGITPVDLR